MARAAGPLRGVGVLVTRPASQAEGLCRRIEALGGRAYRMPSIAIAPPGLPDWLRETQANAAAADLLLFVSANAVDAVAGQLDPWPPRGAIGAVGQATLARLEAQGAQVAVPPRSPYNSEALLSHPKLQDPAGRKVLILRGGAGRELLGETLTARGAEVTYADVYRRVRPEAPSPDALAALQDGSIQITTATSNEGLQNLFDMLQGPARAALLTTPLVVISERMLKLAQELGFRGGISAAPSAQDQSIVEAIVAWQRQTKR